MALSEVIHRVRDELGVVRRHRAELGLGPVLRERLLTHLGLAGVDTSVARATWSHTSELAVLRGYVDDLRTETHDLRTRVTAVEASRDHLVDLLALDGHERLAAASFDADDVLVSVVLPTYDRPQHLERAVTSVLTQLHRRLELLVVDAGGRAETAATLARFDDPRLRVLPATGATSGAARNLALEQATGELVVYLDDDNVFLPWWVRAVALAGRRAPDVVLHYGARVVADAPGAVMHEPFSRDRFAERNLVDTNVLAHRRVGALAWNEVSDGAQDWELVAAYVAAGHLPRPIPVRAALYFQDAPGRAMDADDAPARVQRARGRVQALLARDGAERTQL